MELETMHLWTYCTGIRSWTKYLGLIFGESPCWWSQGQCWADLAEAEMRAAGRATQVGWKPTGPPKAEAVSETRRQRGSRWILPNGEGAKAFWVRRTSLVWPTRLGQCSSSEVLVGGTRASDRFVLTAFAFTLSCPLLSWLLPFVRPWERRWRMSCSPALAWKVTSHSGPRFHIGDNHQTAASTSTPTLQWWNSSWVSWSLLLPEIPDPEDLKPLWTTDRLRKWSESTGWPSGRSWWLSSTHELHWLLDKGGGTAPPCPQEIPCLGRGRAASR